MQSKKYIGVTMLFREIHKRGITGCLKSYVVSKQFFKEETKKIIKQEEENCFQFLGFEDFFMVSGEIKEFAVLGKSYLNELRTIKQSKSLVKKKYAYHINNSKIKFPWILISIVYFYEDKQNSDSLTISCLLSVKAEQVKNMENFIEKVKSSGFKKKVVSQLVDEMNYNYLSYVGIEDITYIESSNNIKKAAFQVLYSNFKSEKALKEALPAKAFLNRKRKFIFNF